jgi:nascent polypeptide-associated complex subunit alpha
MRMMQKMGMKVDELPDVSEVIIKTGSKDIVIEAPDVTLVTVQGQTMYQIAGGRVSEAKPRAIAENVAPEADVQLVVQQTGKTPDEARNALAEAGGDLAKAILSLKSQTAQKAN